MQWREVPFYAHLALITTYSQLRQCAGNLTEGSAKANFTRAVSNYALFFLILRRNSDNQISNVVLRSKNNIIQYNLFLKDTVGHGTLSLE